MSTLGSYSMLSAFDASFTDTASCCSQATTMSCLTPTSTTGGSTRVGYHNSQRLVNRLKNTNPEKFSSLVHMHLSFLLDLSGSSLEEFLCSEDQEADHKSVSKLLFASFGKKRCHKDRETKTCTGIFGQTLTQEAIEAVFPLIDFLKKPECLSEEGLFRKSGQAVRQRNLQEALNTGNQTSQVEEDLLNGVYTAHDCASVIKMFLRELPEPLLMSRHYIAYTQIPGMNSQRKQMQTLQLLIQLLPHENAFLLRVLLELLHRVALEPTNKMTADTLATLFAPHLLVPRTTNANDLQTESCNVTTVVSFMITHHAEIFEYPSSLVRDIQLYWDDMDGGMDLNKTSVSREGLSSDDDLDSASCPRFRKRVDPLDRTLNTTVCFVNRQASDQSSADFTNKQIAELYAYVSEMPDSPQKRRFVKQFNKVSHCNGTPVSSCDTKARRHTASLSGSIRKMMCKTPAKRKNSYDLAQQCGAVSMPDSSYTPRQAKSHCYAGDIVDANATPTRGNHQCALSLRRQIQESIHIECSKLPMGSSHSSLSSTSSTDTTESNCDACSIHSNTSLATEQQTPTSPSMTSCCEPSMCSSRLHNNNNNEQSEQMSTEHLQSPTSLKFLNSSLRAHSSQMFNVLSQDLPHTCYQDIEEENKENTISAHTVLMNTNSTSETDSIETCAYVCEEMDVSMETQSPMATSLLHTPTPTCIRA